MNDEAERRQAAIEQTKAEVARLTEARDAAKAETQAAFDRFSDTHAALSKAEFYLLNLMDGGPIED